MQVKENHTFTITFEESEFSIFKEILDAAKQEDIISLKHLKRDIIEIIKVINNGK